MTKLIPEGYHAVTPSLAFKDSEKAIEFYKKAFGAKVLDLFPNLNGRGIMHATIQIGNSILMMGDENPGCKRPKLWAARRSVFTFMYRTWMLRSNRRLLLVAQ